MGSPDVGTVGTARWAQASTPLEHLTPHQTPMKLHDAMIKVLKADPLGMMRAVHLAAAINERGLYRMGDGRPVEGQQVSARVGR